ISAVTFSLSACSSPGTEPGTVLYCSTYGLVLAGCSTLSPDPPPFEPAAICARSGTIKMMIDFLNSRPGQEGVVESIQESASGRGPYLTCHVRLQTTSGAEVGSVLIDI